MLTTFELEMWMSLPPTLDKKTLPMVKNSWYAYKSMHKMKVIEIELPLLENNKDEIAVLSQFPHSWTANASRLILY